MAGVFFLGRILIYHTEHIQNNVLCDVFIQGARRVFTIIIIPALIVTLITGMVLMLLTNAYTQTWMHLKLLLVVGFLFYTFYLNYLRIVLLKGVQKYSSGFLRLFNEVPFIFLVFITSLVIFRSAFLGSISAIALVIMIGFFFLLRRFFK
jgi:putative membrane protein